MSDDDDLSDDELLALPEDAIPAGGRLWALRSEALQRRTLDERAAELSGNSLHHYLINPDQDPNEKRRREEQRRRDEEFEQALRVVRERQDRPLVQIDQAQRENDERRKQIEDNALRLRDGRRVYVDGDHYRDAQGRVLTGADEAEAARQHEHQPDASTWEQKQEAERQAEDLRRQKERILKDREEGGAPEEAGRMLDGYEKEFAQQAAARQAEVKTQNPTDYGTADYMAAYGDDYQISSKPEFTRVATVSYETIQQPSETETESASTDNKKTPRPIGQGGLKLG